MLLLWLYCIPLLASLLCLFPLPIQWPGRLQILANSLLLFGIVPVITTVATDGPISLLDQRLYLDAFSALLLLLIGGISLLAALYGQHYMRHEEADTPRYPRKLRIYYSLFNLFVLSMMVMVTVNNLGMYWIAIEASTIFSAFLVGFYSKKESVEAAWKYIILCTVGIAFALIGLTLTYYTVQKAHGNIQQGLDWTYLCTVAATFDPILIKAAFIFILIGFGTKAGLAPLHNWLPDAHSESPTPISGLLSGVLLNCALYGIVRYSLVANMTLGPGFTHQFFIFFGLLSIAIATPFILLQNNLKRLLAYSSVEHVGIIATGFGFGAPMAVFGALFHMFNHGLAKCILFFAAGHLSEKFHDKTISHIQNALHVMPLTASLMLLAGLALLGTPPFSVFISEFYIVWGGISQQYWIESVLFILLLAIVFGGFGYQLLRMTVGPSPIALAGQQTGTIETACAVPPETNWPGLVAMLIPFVLLLVLTWWIPAPLLALLHQATTLISGGHV
jgi:hydrogenase-4 component F